MKINDEQCKRDALETDICGLMMRHGPDGFDKIANYVESKLDEKDALTAIKEGLKALEGE